MNIMGGAARALDKQGVPQKGIKRPAPRRLDRFGEWSGTFIHAQERHGNLHCTRVQE